MKRLLLVMMIVAFTFLCGCAFFEGFWKGITGEASESQKTATKIVKLVDEVNTEAKEDGKIDIEKSMQIFNEFKDYIRQNEEEKIPFLQLLGLIFGGGALSYITARRVRKSAIGTFLNSIVSIVPKIFKKTKT